MKYESEEYYIGLDMGTSSVGWAVTDPHYHLIRKKGKDLWGARLFEKANTAQERRTNRINRRRNQRRKQRIAFIREAFRKEVEKVDVNFFRRLDESQLYLEDKSIKEPYLLFNDLNYTDKDFYHQYPTVFHLITDLLTSDRKFDIREIYIAVSSLYNHRGNFLNKSLGNETQDEDLVFKNLDEAFSACGMNWNTKAENIEVVKQILCDRSLNKKEKQDQLAHCLEINKKTEKEKIEFLKLLTGGKADSKKMFSQYHYERDEKLSFAFADEKWEETLNAIEERLTSDEYSLILALKSVYDWSILADLMKNEKTGETYPYLSMARKDSYEKHKADLRLLKSVIKRLIPNEYNHFFREYDEKGKTYTNYIGSVQYHEKRHRFKHITTKEFYDGLKKLLKPYSEDEEIKQILQDIESETFLPKQITNMNGVIPNQVHAKELKVILEKASQHYDFLNETNESGLTVKEQIMQMFTFQIPYYVGPLANLNGKGNGWAVRYVGKERTKVYPWNMDEVIDEKETADQFIKRMISTCTYLGDEYVLPKSSILYEKFAVLNELNSLKINGQPISVDLKQKIYRDLFTKGKRVTQKGLLLYLKREGVISKSEETILSGFDIDFKNTLSSYRKFCEVFATNELNDEQIRMAEDIIEWLTVFGDSKKFVREKIHGNYPQITANQLKRILSFNFKDWGKLSKQFLELEGENRETGKSCSLIQALWDTNNNLNQLLSSRFTYKENLEKKRKKIEKDLFEFTHEDLDDLYISAPVKRMIWQALKIMKDIVIVMKESPTKLFIEMTRNNENEKTRTVSRKNKLVDLYKKIKGESRDWMKELERYEEKDFRSKKLYLYYMQMGKSAYSGEPIDMDKLFDKNVYDIDHIYPQSKVKDDSLLNNCVLVKRKENMDKGNNFPIDPDIQTKQEHLWKFWLEKGLITQEKFNRLTRKKPFTNDELADFVNRQLVETGQATKTIADLFKMTFPNSDIVYVKAGNVTDFRQYIEVYKCREVNNLHHAYDAYLNVVVGNVYDTKFTKNPMNYIKEQRKENSNERYHMDKIFEFPVIRNGKEAWITKKDESINIVRKTLARKTPLVTKRNFEANGTIAKETIYPKGNVKDQGYLPRKTSIPALRDMKKYGGVTRIKIAYFFLVEHEVKKKRIRTIECVPIYRKEELKTKEQLERYCREELKLINPSIRLEKIKPYSLLKMNGNFFYITGKTNDRFSLANAMELYVDKVSENHIRDLVKYKNCGYFNVDDKEARKRNERLYTILTKKHLTVFKGSPKPMGEKLQQYQQLFLELEVSKQVYILLQILQLTATNVKTKADLTAIGGIENDGTMDISKNLENVIKNQIKKGLVPELMLINQSPTGLFESEIDLLTI